MKRTDEPDVQQSAKLAKGDTGQRSNVVGLAQYKEKQAVDDYRKALQTVVANAQKADW